MKWKKARKNAAIISFNYSEEREKGVAIKKEKRTRTKTNLSEKKIRMNRGRQPATAGRKISVFGEQQALELLFVTVYFVYYVHLIQVKLLAYNLNLVDIWLNQLNFSFVCDDILHTLISEERGHWGAYKISKLKITSPILQFFPFFYLVHLLRCNISS